MHRRLFHQHRNSPRDYLCFSLALMSETLRRGPQLLMSRCVGNQKPAELIVCKLLEFKMHRSREVLVRHARMHVATPRWPLGRLFRLPPRLLLFLIFVRKMYLRRHRFELTGLPR